MFIVVDKGATQFMSGIQRMKTSLPLVKGYVHRNSVSNPNLIKGLCLKKLTRV